MNLKQDLEKVLNEIGWWRAKAINPSLIFHMLPNERGGLLFKDKTEADRSAKALDEIISAMKAFENAEHRLTEPQRFVINCASAEQEEYETGDFRDRLANVVAALHAVVPGVKEAKDQTIHEHRQYWSGQSASKNSPAYLIAAKIAEIYVLGLGKRPTYGTSPSGELSTLYARTTKKVFGLLGIDARVRGPCKEAIVELRKGRLGYLLKKRKQRGRRISLFTGRVMQ